MSIAESPAVAGIAANSAPSAAPARGITLTEAAARRIRKQLGERGRGIGLRVGVKKTGCSGWGYVLDYADEAGADDVVFEGHDARVVVKRADLALIDGLRLDFRREGLSEMFKFDNPNAAALCGCGESFTLAAKAGG